MSDTTNNILWTATDFTLPETLWKRLEGLGYKVLMADSNDNMPEKIQNLSPRLWIGQINGEPESGLSRLQHIKSKFPALPVILMSNQPSIEDAVRAIKLGASEYITGSISSEQLWVMIEGALRYPCPRHIPQPKRSNKFKAPALPIAVHHSMLKIMDLAKKIAPSRSTALINGETGVGKEVLARFIHNNSDRKDGPFIAVNCAALPENLLESELFGHEKGAFTGAVSRKKGKFELANDGTLLLDEISEMDVSIQAKLLRVLQEREIDRLGGQSTIPVDVRVIATTNKDLEAETKNGNFRLDLFYRLNVVPLHMPPLKKRPDDIAPLGNFFLKKYCPLNNIQTKRLSPSAEEFLKKRAWPGNVRELENLLERATLLIESDIIHAHDLELICNPEKQAEIEGPEKNGAIPLKEMEKRMILQALDDHKGNRTHAAKVLGISVRTLRNKLHEYKKELNKEGASAQDQKMTSSIF
ncbi:MAG: sigma-54-dependent Fis family transcriptional regulator [Deltaproteobacteria bacterium]|nr:sigma-54-dependent Fis family transcriptional regulator [Deltaproteobacteria bacterium]